MVDGIVDIEVSFLSGGWGVGVHLAMFRAATVRERPKLTQSGSRGRSLTVAARKVRSLTVEGILPEARNLVKYLLGVLETRLEELPSLVARSRKGRDKNPPSP